MKSAICAVLCITGVSLFLSNERNRHAFASKGSIQEGAMFGISVGDTRLTVDKFYKKRLFNRKNWGTENRWDVYAKSLLQ